METTAFSHSPEMMTTTAGPIRQPLAGRAIAALSSITVALHVIVNQLSPYGFQRDEFLYMAMGRHLRLWRMDFPPFIAIVSQVERFVLGDSIAAIRFLPAVAAGLLVMLSAFIARELGGGKFAQLLAAVAVAASPLFLRAGDLFQPVIFDQLWWTLALYALVRLGASAPSAETLATAPRWWIVLGVACGLGLLTKFSLLFFGATLVVALIIAPQRRVLLTPWPWASLVIAFALGSPSIVGQIALGYPVVAQMRTLQGSQLAHVSAWTFVGGQLFLGPAIVLAFAGALYLVMADRMRPFRVVGWTCIGAFMLLLALHGKSYYISPIYPTIFAAGALAFERWSGMFATLTAMALRVVVIVLLFATGASGLPLEIPLFSKETTAAFAQRAGLTAATKTNQGTPLKLPQDYADMLGWPELVNAVAHAYDSLPPEKRAQVILAGDNYGEAGALEFYGPKLGLPPVVSAAGSYWFFGPGVKPGTIMISLGVKREDLYRFYNTVTPAGRVVNHWGVPEESDVSIYIAEDPKTTIQAIWPSLAGQN
ncbi:MAG: glycosyltransferase family 39 protein [Gemmatimonadota bacterium]|nr:glycosyltransferase family 39 protein [Gemmatimonadota bacterium]